jgi:putative membrane protein
MRRRVIRSTVVGAFAVLAAAWPAAGIVLANQQPAQAETSAGSVSSLDREFLTVIRFANLWEIPMGQLAQQRGTTDAVKTAGATMLADHTQLNTAVKQMADKYGVQLPDQPTSSQQSWIKEISSKTGKEFDQTFANRLRAAHGTVFGLVAEVRAGTRNDDIRAFATTANNIVMKHMTLLEATGLVSPDTGMFAEASARTLDRPENQIGSNGLVLALVLGVVMLALTMLVVRTLSSPRSAER